jgi:GNAT superfamily N-acetyltransferase
MDFSLSNEIVEQIVFAMEDQQYDYYIHRHSGELMREDQFEEEAELPAGPADDPYVIIPEWQPSDGFMLMESFVSRLRNPVMRTRLAEALTSRRGVFRRFKDTLRYSPEIERLWFAFKDREMRQVVREWYNDERELAGLARLEEEMEDLEGLDDLLGSEFTVVPGEQRHLEAIRELDKAEFEARYPDADPGRVAEAFRQTRSALSESEQSLIFAAETPEKEFAGFIWALEVRDDLSPERILQLQQIAVVERFQGIGLGTMLLKRMIKEAGERGFHRLRGDLEGKNLQLAEFFGKLGFEPSVQVMELDPTGWDE